MGYAPLGGPGPQGVNRKNCCARLKHAQQFLLQLPQPIPPKYIPILSKSHLNTRFLMICIEKYITQHDFKGFFKYTPKYNFIVYRILF